MMGWVAMALAPPYRPLSTRFEHAGAPRRLQPLLKRATIDGFLLPGLAIAGAGDVAVEQELAQVRQGQRVVLRRGLRNALDMHREGLRAQRWCGRGLRRLRGVRVWPSCGVSYLLRRSRVLFLLYRLYRPRRFLRRA